MSYSLNEPALPLHDGMIGAENLLKRTAIGADRGSLTLRGLPGLGAVWPANGSRGSLAEVTLSP